MCARTFSFRASDWTISVSTTQKRERLKLRASNYHRGKLKGRQPTSAQICLHRDGEWYAHIQIKEEAPKTRQTTNVIGVDFGRREIAKTSTNQGWDGKQIKEVRDKYSRVRASLQKKASQGTRTTRRRCRQILQRLSGRERRFQSWLNHNISRTIIAEALSTKSAVAVEDLSGIRERINQKPRNKTERRRSNSWVARSPECIREPAGDAFRTFYQLRQFLEYKGIKEGVEVLAVPPQYTSQTCHCCLHIGLRSAKSFKCANKACGWIGDADLNGAMNIKHLGAALINLGCLHQWITRLRRSTAYAEAVKAHPLSPWSTEAFLNLARTQGQGHVFAPGTGWAYSNIGYLVLKIILEKTTGLSLQQLFEQVIFSPLSLQKTFVPSTIDDVEELTPGYTAFFSDELRDMSRIYHPLWVAHSVVISTAPELAKIIDALFGGEILDHSLVKQMSSPIHILGKYPLFGNLGYGLGLFIYTDSRYGKVLGHIGGGPGYATESDSSKQLYF